MTQGTNFIRGYDPKTGTELWRLSGNSEVTVPTPIVAKDLIVVTNGYRGVQPIFAIKPGAKGDITLKGEETKSDAIAWSTKRGGPYMPTPVIYGDYLYVVLEQRHAGRLRRCKTGERAYQERLGGKGGAFSASPVAADGKIYLASEDGDVFVVKAGPTYELLATNPMGEVLMATPAISDGVLYRPRLEDVYAIGATASSAAPVRQVRRAVDARDVPARRCSTRPTTARSWHGTNLRGSLRRIEPRQIIWRAGRERHNIWELVVHAAYWKYAVRRRVAGEPRGSFPLAGSNWFARDGRASIGSAWARDVALLAEEHRRLREAVAHVDAARSTRGRRRVPSRWPH